MPSRRSSLARPAVVVRILVTFPADARKPRFFPVFEMRR